MDFVKLTCRVVGHKKSLSSTGYGFGALDYFCKRCQKQIGTVALADMSADEIARVAGYGGFSAGV